MDSAKELVLSGETARNDQTACIDTKLEVIVIPVSNVDRAKQFYAALGWRLDVDRDKGNDFRVIQFTPPGSQCSVVFVKNVTSAEPGSGQGLLIVSDIESAQTELVTRGVDTSEVFHCSSGFGCRFPDRPGRVNGVHPERLSYGSFISFRDPDGNLWQLQEVTSRLPGRVAGETIYTSPTDLSAALHRAAVAHGHFEQGMGQTDPNWADWYADYMVREQKGKPSPL